MIILYQGSKLTCLAEYIGQLEGEIANKVSENQRLHAENRALTAENARLQDLTRLLLGHPSFSQFLNELSTSPTTIVPQQPQQQQQPTPPNVMEQPQQEARQAPLPKDPNPFMAQQQQDMNINFAMIPDQNVDFSMLDLNNNDFIYQPQVYSVHSVPEVIFDSAVLSEKPSTQLPSYEVAEEKEELPVFPVAKIMEPVISEPEHHVDEEFDSDPKFALFTSPPPKEEQKEDEADQQPLDIESIVANIKPAKAFLNFKLVNIKEANAAERRFQRLCASLDAATERLQHLSTSS